MDRTVEHAAGPAAIETLMKHAPGAQVPLPAAVAARDPGAHVDAFWTGSTLWFVFVRTPGKPVLLAFSGDDAPACLANFALADVWHEPGRGRRYAQAMVRMLPKGCRRSVAAVARGLRAQPDADGIELCSEELFHREPLELAEMMSRVYSPETWPRVVRARAP